MQTYVARASSTLLRYVHSPRKLKSESQHTLDAQLNSQRSIWRVSSSKEVCSTPPPSFVLAPFPQLCIRCTKSVLGLPRSATHSTSCHGGATPSPPPTCRSLRRLYVCMLTLPRSAAHGVPLHLTGGRLHRCMMRERAGSAGCT
jgi:hypothetical protein